MSNTSALSKVLSQATHRLRAEAARPGSDAHRAEPLSRGARELGPMPRAQCPLGGGSGRGCPGRWARSGAGRGRRPVSGGGARQGGWSSGRARPQFPARERLQPDRPLGSRRAGGATRTGAAHGKPLAGGRAGVTPAGVPWRRRAAELSMRHSVPMLYSRLRTAANGETGGLHGHPHP